MLTVLKKKTNLSYLASKRPTWQPCFEHLTTAASQVSYCIGIVEVVFVPVSKLARYTISGL